MANINAILSGGKREKRNDTGAGYTVKMLHYSKLVPSKKQNREERKIEELADLLELSGEIKQPLLVRKVLGDKYEVIAGHRRRLAAIYNVEHKGLKEFEFLPCKIEASDEVDAEISLIITNTGFDSLTDLEQVKAVMRLKELLPKKENNGDLKGRELRRRIAETLNKSATKIGQLEHIGKNLSEAGQQALETGKINISLADALASLPVEKQDEFLQKPDLKVKDVKKTGQKQGRKAGQDRGACDGQVSIPEEPDIPEDTGLSDMKNKKQRKEFLDTFHNWRIWFQVPEASEIYYRYDLPDGCSFVVCEYNSFCEWMAQYRDMDPEQVHQRYYLLTPGYHYLHDCLSNRTALVEHLKEMQKEDREK